MRSGQPCRKIEEGGLEKHVLGRNNSISKGPGAGKAAGVSMLSREVSETSGKGSGQLLLTNGP